MSSCLVCGSQRFAALFQASDRLYHTTSKKFAVVRERQSVPEVWAGEKIAAWLK